MAVPERTWWYDGQMRRFLEQIVLAFSNFKYQTGMRAGQPPQLVTVPCRMASTDFMVASINRNLSENALNTVPMITVFQNGLSGERERLQDMNFVGSMHVTERAIDETGQYTGAKGASYTVQRLMPLPFKMSVQVDIWTSNTDQKHQLAEQILTQIYPGFDIQNSDNPLDWTALSTVTLADDITWSSLSMPIGAGGEIDIMSLSLTLPIWLSPPAKIKKQVLINEIITTVSQASQGDNGLIVGTEWARLITTPGNYCVMVSGGSIQLLAENARETDQNGSLPVWADLLKLYGTYRDGQSEIRLYLTEDIDGPFISGSIHLGSQDNILTWTIDPSTLPANTLPPVAAVIDPLRSAPGNGLPVAIEGARYLLVKDIGPNVEWGNLSAHEDDIVQFVSGAWQVAQAASDLVGVQYVLNSRTGSQLRWDHNQWVMAIDGQYGPGHWRLFL